ncbi:nuclear transport factor 2 family protein (plasmid) [Streptomyces sp. BI20]|uniref:nuclear transport factor 2 family protein n=1 Tax=Streptomyces sp. BI20 TaxID=3403460 RepID=UPI003C762FE9
MSTADRFAAAVDAADLDALAELFTEDVRLNSPVTSKPFEGREAVLALFRVLLRTFEDFRYVGRLAGEVGAAIDAGETDRDPAAVLVFRTAVGGRPVHGIDLLHLTDDGRIGEITVMLRPQRAVVAVGEAVLAGLTADGHVTT